MEKGKFIAFEGPEGCGKTTQIKRLSDYLTSRGVAVTMTREPGGTNLAELIRKVLQTPHHEPPVPEAEVMLFEASRAQHVQRLIAPALADGSWVLCDRFEDSTFAYQGFGRGFDVATLRRLNAFATQGVTPDLVLVLDVPPEVSLARILARQAASGVALDRIEQEPNDFHRRLRDGFLQLAQGEPARYAVIDATRDIESVWSAVLRTVTERLAP